MASTQVFHTVGRRWLNQILNGSVARPATLYMGLRTLDGVGGHASDAAAADTLSSNLYEASGCGYARQAITFNATNFPETLSGSDSILTVAQQTFDFGTAGTLTGVTHSFLATTSDNTGVLIVSAPLGATRNFVGAASNGDQLKVTMTVTTTQGS